MFEPDFDTDLLVLPSEVKSLDITNRRRLPFLSRVRSFVKRPSSRSSLARAVWTLVKQEAGSAVLDLQEALHHSPTITSLRIGRRKLEGGAVAAYVHYAPVAEVSEMVFRQLENLRTEGFSIVFISMAPALPEPVLQRLGHLCGMVVQRRNLGLDFGAWHDVAPILEGLAPTMTELLLVNDSICGPFRPTKPIFQKLRRQGPGLFGLTENLAPRPHLQSYFLLAQGNRAVTDLTAFLAAYQPTASKRRTIRKGEIRLSRWMLDKGHTVAALYAYGNVERAAMLSGTARRRLRSLYPYIFRAVPEGSPEEYAGMMDAMFNRPTNATHLFWRELVETFDFPFIKTDLLVRNPLGIADPMHWKSLSLSTDPQIVPVVAAHLSSMARIAAKPATALRHRGLEAEATRTIVTCISGRLP